MTDYEKYLKYKEKYTSLKNMTGGAGGAIIAASYLLPKGNNKGSLVSDENSLKGVFYPELTGSIDILNIKMGGKDHSKSSRDWSPTFLTDGYFDIIGKPFLNNNIHSASVKLKRDVYLYINNYSRFLFKIGTKANIINDMNKNSKTITFDVNDMEVSKEGCVIQ